MTGTLRHSSRISATLAAVSNFSQECITLLKPAAGDDADLIGLAVQELGINIVRHAYAGQSGEISIGLRLDGRQLTITFRDEAPTHYDPPPEITAPDPQDLPVGGWGMFLIYEIMDQVEYERLPDANQWHLIKTLKGV